MGQKCEKFLQQPKPYESQDVVHSTTIDMELEDDMIESVSYLIMERKSVNVLSTV